MERFNLLESIANKTRKFSKDELRELKKQYKEKIKLIK